MTGNYATDHLTGFTSTGRSLHLREAGWRDAWRLWRWRNHPTTRRMMTRRDPIGLLEHIRWFWHVQHQPAIVQYVAFHGHRPVGSGRLDFSDRGRVATFGVVIAPRWRGRGYGRSLVAMLVAAAEEMGAKTLVADVRRENVASLAAFRRAGFIDMKRDSVDDLSSLYGPVRPVVRLER